MGRSGTGDIGFASPASSAVRAATVIASITGSIAVRGSAPDVSSARARTSTTISAARANAQPKIFLRATSQIAATAGFLILRSTEIAKNR